MRPWTRSTAAPEARLEQAEALLGGGQIGVLGFGDQRADPVDALTVVDGAADRVDHLVEPRKRNRARVDRLAARRLLAQLRDVHVAEIGQHQRARNRRRGQHQHVHRLALAREREPLMHAETVLLVDDRQREVAKRDVLLEQRMGADDQVECAVRQARER